MTVEMISWPISTKEWDRAEMELATPGSAGRLASVARHVTDCPMRPSPEWSCVTLQRHFPQQCDCRNGTLGDTSFWAKLLKRNFPLTLSPELWRPNFMKTFTSTENCGTSWRYFLLTVKEAKLCHDITPRAGLWKWNLVKTFPKTAELWNFLKDIPC